MIREYYLIGMIWPGGCLPCAYYAHQQCIQNDNEPVWRSEDRYQDVTQNRELDDASA